MNRRRIVPTSGAAVDNFVRILIGFSIGVGIAVHILIPETSTGKVNRNNLGVGLLNYIGVGALFGVYPALSAALFIKKRIPWAFPYALFLGLILAAILCKLRPDLFA